MRSEIIMQYTLLIAEIRKKLTVTEDDAIASLRKHEELRNHDCFERALWVCYFLRFDLILVFLPGITNPVHTHDVVFRFAVVNQSPCFCRCLFPFSFPFFFLFLIVWIIYLGHHLLLVDFFISKCLLIRAYFIFLFTYYCYMSIGIRKKWSVIIMLTRNKK